MKSDSYPMRINRYLAKEGKATRRDADKLIAAGRVFINDRKAILGDKITAKDIVEVRGKRTTTNYQYYAYYYAPELEVKLPSGVFMIGQLDRTSAGLVIATNDGRLTDRLLSPEHSVEKEYEVTLNKPVRGLLIKHLEAGINLDDGVTKPASVEQLEESVIKIILTEERRHQIRRMCAAMDYDVGRSLRTRIASIKLGLLKPGEKRALEGRELTEFLKQLGLGA